MTMLAGVGSLEARATIYHIVVNLVQSLIPEDTPTQGLLDVSTRLSDPAALELFGLRDVDRGQDALEPQLVFALTRELLDILEAASPSHDTINFWRSRWLTLVTESCFTPSYSTQARSFVVFAQLINGSVDDELLFHVIRVLRGSLEGHSQHAHLLRETVTACLCQIMPRVSAQSAYAPALFWQAMALLQTSSRSTHISSALLVAATLSWYEATGRFIDSDAATVLGEMRRAFVEPDGQTELQLDPKHLQYSLVALLVRGVKVRLAQLVVDARRPSRRRRRALQRSRSASTSSPRPAIACPTALRLACPRACWRSCSLCCRRPLVASN